jgi:coenzyme F420 hydrogenase subunit beta
MAFAERASVERVIAEKLCIGCGACSFADPASFSLQFGADGVWSAQRLPAMNAITAGKSEDVGRVCPFSGAGPDEDEIAAGLWPDLPTHPEIGRHAATIACHVNDEELRMAGGSGGLLTWLCIELLRRGEVDAVVHVQPAPDGDEKLFHYAVSRSEGDIRRGSKSRYYPVTMLEVLQEMTASGERFAVVAVPCFAKAIRALVAEGKLAQERIPYVVGLVCGHMKSRFFADYLAWQRDVAPGNLIGFDFRHKLMDRPASNYGFRMITGDRNEIHPMSSVRGHDWGEGLFKLPACEFCDDVLAECADVAIGDAWLPEFVGDPKGTNVAVIRNARIAEIVADGRRTHALWATDITPETIALSQASGLRHRREGLAHRLARRTASGAWMPRKRVAPKLAPTAQRQQIYDLRLAITLRSNDAFTRALAANDIGVFEKEMAPVLGKLRQATRGSALRRYLRKLGGLPRRIVRKLLKTIRRTGDQPA